MSSTLSITTPTILWMSEDPDLSRSLIAGLRRSGYVVERGNYQTAGLRAAKRLTFGVIVVELERSETAGLNLIASLLLDGVPTSVLVVGP